MKIIVRLFAMTTSASVVLLFAGATIAAAADAARNSAVNPGYAACLQKAGPAAVVLTAVDRRYQHPTGQGTGFLIREDGVLVTARHVSEQNDALLAITADGKEHRVTGFYGEDRDYDVAVVKFESGCPHVSLAAAPLPQTGQWAAVVTPQPDGPLFCVTGAVTSVRSLPNVFEVVLANMQVRPGQSGSPLLNESAEAIGVVFGMGIDGAAYAVPINVIQRILDRAGAKPVPFAKRPRKGTSTPVILDEGFRPVELAIAQNDWASAEPLARQAARKFPDSPLVLTLLGITEMQRAQSKEANAAFAKVVGLKPDSAFGWLMYGTSSLQCRRYAKSETALCKSMALGLTDKGQLTEAWTLIAVANAAQKDAKGVQEALKNLRGINPARADETFRAIAHDYPRLAL